MAEDIKISQNTVGKNHPVYFIADIAANHDGNLGRAKELIEMASEAGAHAAKFQHFKAKTIVSDYGFQSLGEQVSHQKDWKMSVFDTYEAASIDIEWTEALKSHCDTFGITFFTSPYDFEMVDHVDAYVPAHKIGSGDITWTKMIEYIARKNKPYLISTGASSLSDVQRAVDAGLKWNKELVLMQCNTNYTGSVDNFHHINLKVLSVYRDLYPNLILGLSDHTPGYSTVLGAVSLGAKVIEKHFTDNQSRKGPDHAFSMNSKDWKEMQERTMELETAFGNGQKVIEANEMKTVVLQRRAVRLRQNFVAGHVVQEEDLVYLRPCPSEALAPYQAGELIGKRLLGNKKKHDCIVLSDLE